MQKNLFLLVTISAILLLFPVLAFADDSGLITKLVEDYRNQTGAWINIAKQKALILFGICATLEIAWLGVKAALGQAEIGESLKNFVITLCACGLFLAVINNYEEWAHGMVKGLQSVAGEMTSLKNTPDAPFKLGLEVCDNFLKAIQKMSLWDEAGLILCSCFALVIIIICFCMITANYILILCESYIAMAAACILVGFGGSSFFRDYAINVLKYILSVAFKLFTLQLVIGLGFQFIQNVVKSSNWQMDGVLLLTGSAIVLYALAQKVPETVGGIISGSHAGGGNIGGMKSVILGTGAAAAGAAAGAYYGSRNLGMAYNNAKESGAGAAGGWKGAMGVARGTMSNLYGAWRESATSNEDRQNTIGSKLREAASGISKQKQMNAPLNDASNDSTPLYERLRK